MKCARCKSRGDEAEMKLRETTTHIIMQCPKCNYWKGVKKNPRR